ncbi:MAG: hypothetical protein CMG50_05520 [Candidatus Marinimicrobia bacterium]|nr:hypothetical protein [Candidatus Neomarinimicrobiota bacterium]|tara:strand:- start:40688 stop:41599 length:912 start_codon:yes stop_codon:yes gene_type:complete
MKYNKLSIVGVVVFVSVCIFFYGIRFLQDESFQKSNFIFNVVFNDLQGLDVSDDVRMLGKRIGRVTGTRIIGEKIVVELTIDNDFAFKIPIDSKIEITQTDIMGSKFISIYPGKDNNKFILDSETIAGKNAEVASLTKDIGDVANRLNQTFGNEQKKQIVNTISNIESATKQLEEFITINKNIISSEDKQSLSNIISNIDDISNNLNSLLDGEKNKLSNSVDNFNLFMEKMPSISNEIDEILLDVNGIIKNLNNGNGSLSKLLNNDELYDNINGLVLDARLILDDVKNNPAKYLRAWFEAKKK